VKKLDSNSSVSLNTPEGQRTLQAQRLQTLGVLAGGVAHDLNNILTGILGHVSFLKMSLGSDWQYSDSLDSIQEGARRAASVTQQIVEFARGDEASFRAVNLALVIRSAINLIRVAVSKNIDIRVLNEDEDLFVHGNESQLSQLVINLLVNARDAMPEGGVIDIHLGKVSLDSEIARNNWGLKEGDYARLLVSDSGHGIAPESKEKIFEPFFFFFNKKGTGLGLATVQGIILSHSGAIDVQSEPGKGACFEMLFPLSTGDTKVSSSVVHNIPKGSERILVVDDEEAVRTVIQRTLEHLGYKVDIAGSGAEALENYSLEGNYSLVILDMVMPKMAGDEVFNKLRAIDSQAPVLIASGYATNDKAERVLESGGLGYIQKPFAVEELAKEVRRCLDRKD